MIIENGTIEVKIKTGGGLDPETGYPKTSDVMWSNPIPCQYIANKYNQIGIVGGERFVLANYSVLIEEQDFNAEQILLRDKQGNEIGEFSIIQKEPLEAVGEIRLLI